MRDKIVTVTLGKDLYVKASHVFQYDYGLILAIDGIQLPADYEVHFSNKKHGVAKKGEHTEGGVKIPDEYLRSGEDVFAWVYLRNGDDDGYTVYSIQIPVVARSVEQGDNITPIEHNIIDEAIAALNEGVEHVDEIAEQIPETIDAALQEAKDSGEFDGFSPIATVEKSGNVTTITVTDAEGTTTAEVNDGAEKYVVNFTMDASNTVTCDKTIAEIFEADSSGKVVYALLDVVTGGVTINYTAALQTMTVEVPRAGLMGEVCFALETSGAEVQILGSNVSGTDTWEYRFIYNMEADPSDRAYDARGFGIINVLYPEDRTDAATKGYVDDAVSSIQGMSIHICVSGEYDAQTGIPTIQNPDPTTFYLVPGGETPNLYVEWVYTNNAWEQFGSATIDLSNYAQKTDVPVENGTGVGSAKTKDYTQNNTTYSNTASGVASFAAGRNTAATNIASFAIGRDTISRGACSVAEGMETTAIGGFSHAEGYGTTTSGSIAHAEGDSSEAKGYISHAEGEYSIANGRASHTAGKYNVEDSIESFPEWTANTEYSVGDKVKITTTTGNDTTVAGYICKIANNDSGFIRPKWDNYDYMNYAEIIGNGTSNNARSNAYALDWDGTGHFAGDVYVHANSDSTGGTKVATTEEVNAKYTKPASGIPASDLASGVIPTVPVQDVQVNGTSITSSGVANIPLAGYPDAGVVKVLNNYGLTINNGVIATYPAAVSTIKEANNGTYSSYHPIVPGRQHYSVFYGLSKVAGADLSNKTVTLGTYPDNSKQAIQTMLGTNSMLAPIEADYVADRAYAIGEVFCMDGKLYKATAAINQNGTITPGTNCDETSVTESFAHDVQIDGRSIVSNGVANIPFVDGGTPGVVKTNTFYGITTTNNFLTVCGATDDQIKTAGNTNRVILPMAQHKSVFYGLAKAAGDSTQASSSNAVGTYTSDAKAAIQSMLGVPGDVQINGTSIVSNGVANIPIADDNNPGVIKVSAPYGIMLYNNTIAIAAASDAAIKLGGDAAKPIATSNQHKAVFYGLAKVAGADMKNSSNNVGTYTEDAKSKISDMLNAPVSVSGSTPTITAKSGVRYICGECSTLSITAPASGCIDVIFESGSTPTVLTVTSAKSNTTVKWVGDFDPDSLDADTTYEINIMDGEWGMAVSWT